MIAEHPVTLDVQRSWDEVHSRIQALLEEFWEQSASGKIFLEVSTEQGRPRVIEVYKHERVQVMGRDEGRLKAMRRA